MPVQRDNCLTTIHGESRMKERELREIRAKLMRGFLDLVVLQFLNGGSMHGYQIISDLRKNFGVYFGPSTIYPLLCALEEKGYVKSHWDLENDKPRKVYSITPQGSNLLNCTEDSLNLIYRKLTSKFTLERHLQNRVYAKTT